MPTATLPKTFLDYDKLKKLSSIETADDKTIDQVIKKAMELKGLTTEETAVLLSINTEENLKKLLDAAEKVKQEIYGKRMVLFAPVYTGNYCSNNCVYCGFRTDNKKLNRCMLSQEELASEVESLLKEGHKRILLLCGESNKTPIEHTVESIKTAYSVNYQGSNIRRINVEIAPMSVEEFKILKTANIGTYTCFQETYDPELYKQYHPGKGPKTDYLNRLYVMDRAMEGGIDDVGIGVLFGLADYKYEVLAVLEHAKHLEETFGCGPHTVSVPRIEPASGAPLTENIPFPVSDDEFRKIVAIIRVAMPYTGIILSTREKTELRKEVFHYGVSQVSAGSRTNPGGYNKKHGEVDNDDQFSLGDHRSLDEVISDLLDDGYVPSFCTGCYRKGRVGNDFMDLAKPGLIKQFCLPNGILSFAEYLIDFASPETKEKGFALIEKMADDDETGMIHKKIDEPMKEIKQGKRDLYY